MSLLSVLTVVFVVLKLTGVIAWSWWLVLSPTLAQVGVFLIVLIGGTIYALKDQGLL